ncbi:MAG: efflux RND transporter periplasmic adaptor subunit [Marinicella sp.]
MKHNVLWWLMVITAGFAGYYLASSRQATNPEKITETAQVIVQSINETVLATGVVRPAVGAEINVGSRISGKVNKLPVKIGDRIEQGDVLAELDDSALVAEIEQLKANIQLVKPNIASAQSAYTRQQKITAKGWGSEADLELAERDLQVALAQLEVYQSQIKSAEITLSYATIEAPISGTIANVNTREGETVAADFSAPTFVTIIDLEQLEVHAYVDETDIGQIYIGQQANFDVDTYPGLSLTARVVSIQPKAEIQNSVVNYVVRLVFDVDPTWVLRPEMTAHVEFIVGQRESALMVPRKALKSLNGRQYVSVLKGDVWHDQVIETGWRSNSMVEVVSGVKADDVVALNVK